MGVDFKTVFALQTELLYEQILHQAKRRSRLVSPYMEHLASRFFAFHGRIAIPFPHEPE